MTDYDDDIVAWASDQAEFLRARRFDLLDLENLADEIEAVGSREQRDLACRIVKLLVHFLKWQGQWHEPTESYKRTLHEQRKVIRSRLEKSPGLQRVLTTSDWRAEIWADAVAMAASETGFSDFPEDCPWAMQSEILADEWLPLRG